MPGPPPLRIAVDAADAQNELGRFSNALDRAAGGFETLNKVVTNFNKKGEQVSSVVSGQIAAFETVTQVIDKNGRVIQSTYEKNEAAARRAAAAAAARQAREDKADEARAARAAAKFDAEVKRRNDAIDKEMEKARKAKEKAEKELNKPPPGGNALTDFFSRLTRNFVQFASFRGFNFISQGLMDGVRAAKEFQIQLSLIRTISQDNQQSFAKFGRDVRGVSDESGFDIKDVGKAFYDTTSNQIAKGANVAPFVKAASDLARVTGSELPDSVNLLSSAINAYGLSASDAERISALFFKTIDEGRIVSSELANTFGRVAVLGSNLGVPIEDLNAILAITTQKGLKTSDAMTLLTNLLIKLEKPTEATAGFFKSLGVETGEQAIAMYGLIPLVNKMVEAVKAGKIDVSAFFDEIRGRKQFGIFEQSGDAIQKFADDAKKTSQVVKDYKEALAIRGESPADALNKEINKLSNIFKVDLGQAIVKSAADLVAFVGGVENVSSNVKSMSGFVKDAGIVLLAYGAISGAVALKNYALTYSFRATTVAALGLAKALLPLAAGYYIGTRLFGNQTGGPDVEAKKIEGTIEQLEKMRVAYEKWKASQTGAAFDPLASFRESSENISKAYKSVIELLAQATIINDRFLSTAKEKAKEAADALKTGFGAYTDIFKDKISKIKKEITEANEEIKRSAKSTLKFNESLDEILFKRKEQYANDDFGQQKQQLAEKRLADLYAKKDKLFAQGTEESIAEGRALYDEIARQEDNLFGLRTDYQKKLFEQGLANNPYQQSLPGGNIFSVDTSPLEARLQNLAAMRAKDEERITLAKQKQVTIGEEAEKKEKAKLRTLETAIKNYEKIDLFTKDGKLNPDFADGSGKLDRAKFNRVIGKAEDDIRAVGGPTFEQRVALEALLVAKKKAAIDEVSLYQRQEDLKTAKTQILTEKERTEKSVEDLKKQRDEELKKQREILTSLGSKDFELAGFANEIKAQSNGRLEDRNKVFNKRVLRDEDIKALDEARKKYQAAAGDVINNPIVKNGVAIADPKKAQAAYEAYADALQKFDEIANKYRIQGGTPAFTVEGGQKIGPEAAKQAFRAQLDELKRSGGQLYSGVEAEEEQRESFKKNVLEPVEKLKGSFPDLKVGAQDFSTSANNSFRTLANGGVEDLRKKLEEVRKLMAPVAPAAEAKPAGVGFNNTVGEGDSGYAYAAEGGIVGMFPGQPRGVDRYPIWAAKGERIIDARTSQMYAPMLDAIMNRRMPQYMAGGGIVGGDTHVGDINITVNGARTNSDTARTIGQHLERQLRLNNIRLEKK